MPKKLSKSKNKQRYLILSGLIVVILGAAVYYHHRSTKVVPAPASTITPSGSSASTGANTAKGSGTSGGGSAASTNSKVSTTGDESTSNSSLGTPSGQLGTQHTQAAGATTLIVPKTEPGVSAICTTVSGASCVVIAKGPGGESKTINPDGTNPFNFDWNVSNYNDGTWTIQIVATKDGQSSSATLGTIKVQG